MLRTLVDVNDCPKGKVNVEKHILTIRILVDVNDCPNYKRHSGWANAEHTCLDPMLRTFVDVNGCPKGSVEVKQRHMFIMKSIDVIDCPKGTSGTYIERGTNPSRRTETSFAKKVRMDMTVLRAG